MFCQECKANGKTSKVTEGGSMVTLMGFSNYYDEAGSYHSHDPNIVTQYYSCSNGHSWTTKAKHPCPSCKYPNEA